MYNSKMTPSNGVSFGEFTGKTNLIKEKNNWKMKTNHLNLEPKMITVIAKYFFQFIRNVEKFESMR